MTDENLYWRVHLNNGEIWFCQKFGHVKDIFGSDYLEEWANDTDYGMTGAVLDRYVDTTDVPPSPFVVLSKLPCAIEKLSVPRLSGYHRHLENHMEHFA